MEYPNPSQPNPGLRTDGTPCTDRSQFGRLIEQPSISVLVVQQDPNGGGEAISSNCDEDGEDAVSLDSISPVNSGTGVRVEWTVNSRLGFDK